MISKKRGIKHRVGALLYLPTYLLTYLLTLLTRTDFWRISPSGCPREKRDEQPVTVDREPSYRLPSNRAAVGDRWSGIGGPWSAVGISESRYAYLTYLLYLLTLLTLLTYLTLLTRTDFWRNEPSGCPKDLENLGARKLGARELGS